MFQANYVFMEKLCVLLWLVYDNAVVISRLGPPTWLPIEFDSIHRKRYGKDVNVRIYSF